MKNGKFSMFEIYNRTMPKGMHKAAYRGRLSCPWWGCSNMTWDFYNKQGFLIVYKCKRCGQLTAYDVSRQLTHPFIGNLKTIEV